VNMCHLSIGDNHSEMDSLLLNCYTVVADGPLSVAISPSGGLRIAHGHVMTCSSEGNPRPSYQWTIELLGGAYNTTFPAAELVVDVCNLTSWSSQKNLSGTTSLKLTCHAQNMIRGKLRTASVQEMYDLSVFKNMDKVCGKDNSDYDMMELCNFSLWEIVVKLKISIRQWDCNSTSGT